MEERSEGMLSMVERVTGQGAAGWSVVGKVLGKHKEAPGAPAKAGGVS